MSVRRVRSLVVGCALALAALLGPMAAQAGTDSWTLLGPQGGGVTTFVFDAAHPATMYVGTLWGAVFKSTDSGASWTATSSGIVGATVVYSLAIDPTNASILYAGTDVGIFKSVNGGASWNLAGTGLQFGGALAIDPASPSTLYAFTALGLTKSTDGGVTWTAILPRVNIGAIAIDPSHPATIYVAADTGIFKTVDGGATWASVIPFQGPYLTLALDPSQPATLYAGNLFGVFKTTDGGTTWNITNSGLPTLPTIGVLAIDPRSPGTVYAANGFGDARNLGVYKTTDGGATWSEMGAGLIDTYVYGLAIDPTSSAVYAATASGACKTTTGGASWAAIDSGLTAFDVAVTAIDPTNPATLYAGTDGNGVFKSSDGGASWSAASTGLTAGQIVALAIDPSRVTTLYAATSGDVFKSVDGGASWSPINSGLPLTGGLDFVISTLAIDPSHPTTLYLATDDGAGVWKTVDGGNSWTSIASALGGSLKLVIDPSQTTTMYSADSVLMKSTDGGATWFESDTGIVSAADPEGVRFYDVAIDPAHSATLYAATEKGFFRSTDAGATWTAASCGLPSIPFSRPLYSITALAVDPRSPATVYAAGNGVFKTVDGGTTWTAIDSGLTGISVQSLSFDASTSTLYAGTEGRSVFSFADSGQASPPPPVLCVDDHPGDARFTIRVHYQTQQGGSQSGDGRAIPLASVGVSHGGLFWFFDADNPEMLGKVINGCAVDQKFWLFYSAGTNVGLTTTVDDHATGATKTYTNADLTAAPPVQDTSAFDCLQGDSAPDREALAARLPSRPASGALPPQPLAAAVHPLPGRMTTPPNALAAANCSPGPATLCIGGRFKIEAAYQTVQDGGQSGMGQAVALDGLGVSQGGLFWFFSLDNPEMLIKVIDACALQGKYWVFYSAATNVGLQVTVTDTQTGAAVRYTNPDLTAAPPVQDTSALPCT